MTDFADQSALFERNVWRYFEGLTNEELHWEPAPNMWGLRKKSELRTPLPLDTPECDWWLDGIRPRPNPEPLTTIGWRVAHLILGSWNWLTSLKELEPRPRPEPGLTGDVESLIPLWKSVFDEFVGAAKEFTEAALAAEVQAGTSRFRRSRIVSHMTLEITAHGAEVGTMRHLFRATSRPLDV
jgi:hypothetical protein